MQVNVLFPTVDNVTYTMRSGTNEDCHLFVREIVQLIFQKSITSDEIVACDLCGSDLCNS